MFPQCLRLTSRFLCNINIQPVLKFRAFATFTPENIPQTVHKAEYAVRGPIERRAKEIRDQLEQNPGSFPFKNLVFCNIGNPQAFAPPPITFHRQVLSCLMYPPLMTKNLFAKDIVDRATFLLNGTGCGSLGAYSDSQGFLNVRESVAKYIENRDGCPSDPKKIYLTAGASSAIRYILECLGSNPSDGILIPVPQYPLYSATLALNNTSAVGYYLDESDDWSVSVASVEQAIAEAKASNITTKAIVIINPGNPTGQCMSARSINDILALAYKHSLVVLADEVYQENIYDKVKYPFVSFKKMLCSHSNQELANNLELLSFHSVSKGIFGECGLRGGYMELTNINVDAQAILTKLVSINLCSNTIGQSMIELMVNPPKPGDESYPLFKQEYDAQYNSLKDRAAIISSELNKIDGITCNTIYGAMYAFPTIHLPPNVVKNATKAYENNEDCGGKPVDFIYCWELLEATGMCVVPGSGFKQATGTSHFRTTLLPPKDQIEYCVTALTKFHQQFVQKYG